MNGHPPDPEGFAEFYALYPRHIARDAAIKAWRAAVLRATATEILAGLARLRPSLLNVQDKKYIPYPATWLNAGRWADDPRIGSPEDDE